MDLTDLIEKEIPSPVSDNSGAVSCDESDLIRRLMIGDELIVGRVSLAQGYGVRFYWGSDYCPQYDVSVMRLLGRQLIRPVSCFGGFTHMEFTERAKEVLLNLSNNRILGVSMFFTKRKSRREADL